MLRKLPSLKWGSKKQKPTPSAAQSQKMQSQPEPAPATVDTSAAVELLQHSSIKKRLQACLQIKDTDLLLKTSREDADDQVRLAAARQYARHLESGNATRELINNYRNTDENRHLARLITAHHSDAAMREYGIQYFTTDDDLADIAIETRFHDTRTVVSEKIASLEATDKVWRAIKSKDKVVARKLKERLTEHQKSQQLQQQQQQEVTKIVEEMDKLATGVWSPSYINRFELFDSRWEALDFEISAADQARYKSLKSLAKQKVDTNRNIQQQHNDAQQCIDQLGSIAHNIRSSTLDELPDVLQSSRTAHNSVVEQWTSLTDRAAPDQQLSTQFEQSKSIADQLISHAYTAVQTSTLVRNEGEANMDGLIRQKKQLGKAIESLQSNQNITYAKELPDLLQLVTNKTNEQSKAIADLKGGIHKQLGSLNSAINANRWGPARSIHERLSKKIARLPQQQQPSYTEKLQRIEARLTELGDWKQFATEPKLAELCEQMEKVPSLQLTPKDQADRIKDLQSQWKAMGSSPAQEAHWPRFKTAADIAFEPCAKYFAKKRADKEDKLGKRAVILSMLNDYVEKSDWQAPDWRLVEKTIRTAKSEWRNHRVFDRKATAKQEQEFTEVLTRLNEKLAPAYEAGANEKAELIAKVKTLGEGEINQHCINQVKRLQSMWRRTGIVQRADDQRLWREFNDACSEIYNTHRGNQKEQHAASVEHVTRARQIIKDIKQAAGDNSGFDEKSLQQLQDEFQSLPEFPEKEQKFIFRDFNRAVEALDKQRQRQTDSALQKQVTRLHHNANVCDQLEALAGGTATDIEQRLAQLLEEWEDGDRTDNLEWRKAISLRKDSIIKQLQNGTLPDYEANTLARKLLCIDLEILLDRETPSEDKALRMQHQLEQLQQGLSANALTTSDEQARALEVKWLTSLPADPAIKDKLNTRFTTALGR